MTIQPLTLAFDIGSHACRAALIDHIGKIVYVDSMDIDTHNPFTSHYEQDPKQIVDSCKTLIKKLPSILVPAIKQAGLCTQRSSIVAWDKETGLALSPIISWRDLRNTPLINELEIHTDEIKQISGLQLSAHYSASKIRWLLDNSSADINRSMENNSLCISPIASYLLFHLLEQPDCVIDHSNAQRTQLFDIHSLDWSTRLLKLYQLNKKLLPICRPVIFPYGQLRDLEVNLTTVCGDQNAAFHGFPDLATNDALVNIGTGAFVLSHLPEKTKPGHLLHSLVKSTKSSADFVSEGTVNGAASALDKFISEADKQLAFSELDKSLQKTSPPGIFINTISGLGSPWWCEAGAAEFTNEKNMNHNQKLVAIIESIVFLLCCNIEQLAAPLQRLHVSGGLSRLNGLCQKLASLSQIKTIQYCESESTLTGCAVLACQLDDKNKITPSINISSEYLPVSDKALNTRYQQFVGELKKRCNNN